MTSKTKGRIAKYYSLTKDDEGCHDYYYQHIIEKLAKEIKA